MASISFTLKDDVDGKKIPAFLIQDGDLVLIVGYPINVASDLSQVLTEGVVAAAEEARKANGEFIMPSIADIQKLNGSQ
jgi:hypothetical protein